MGRIILEASWEVANKVGGIYTVLASKAERMRSLADEYYAIGPYIEEKAALDFTPQPMPAWLERIAHSLEEKNIILHYGVWEVKGKPNAILLSYDGLWAERNAWRKRFWEAYRVDTIRAGSDVDHPMLWSISIALLLQEWLREGREKPILHAHEWLSGSSILASRLLTLPVKTVFTTHATMLGRSVSARGEDPLSILNPRERAWQLGIEAKHTLEEAAARNADVFTTVSRITAEEAAHLLGRTPDAILPNGLDLSQFPDSEEIPIQHRVYREKLREFLIPYFFPSYELPLEHTLFYYISGRYEYENKGIDVFIQALGRLNKVLKETGGERHIVAFFFIPASVKRIRYDLLKAKAIIEDVSDALDESLQHAKRTILRRFIHTPAEKLSILHEDAQRMLKKAAFALTRQADPPLSTHILTYEEEDAILNAFRREGLLNRKEDRVKVILYPAYLNRNDGLINLDYYPAIQGCHLGVFPSKYEPWGYTPLESIAYGVPAITTDIAGFGDDLLQKGLDGQGVYVLRRKHATQEETITRLTSLLTDYALLPHDARLEEKHKALHTAKAYDWKELIKHYEMVYDRLVG